MELLEAQAEPVATAEQGVQEERPAQEVSEALKEPLPRLEPEALSMPAVLLATTSSAAASPESCNTHGLWAMLLLTEELEEPQALQELEAQAAPEEHWPEELEVPASPVEPVEPVAHHLPEASSEPTSLQVVLIPVIQQVTSL